MISITSAQAKLRIFLDMPIYDNHNVNGVACTHHPVLLAIPKFNILNIKYKYKYILNINNNILIYK